MSNYNEMLVATVRRAEQMERRGLISLPDGDDGDEILSEFCCNIAASYWKHIKDREFYEYIERRLAERFPLAEQKTPPQENEAEDGRLTITVSGYLAKPWAEEGEWPIHMRLAWDAMFGEKGDYYLFDCDGGDGYMDELDESFDNLDDALDFRDEKVAEGWEVCCIKRYDSTIYDYDGVEINI